MAEDNCNLEYHFVKDFKETVWEIRLLKKGPHKDLITERGRKYLVIGL